MSYLLSPKNTKKHLSDSKVEIIKRLREEAGHAKNCFTQYTFQSLVFSSAAIGLILSHTKDKPINALSVLPITVLLVIMSWIGIYKYATANRAYGLQQFIEKQYIFSESRIDSEEENEAFSAFKLIVLNDHWEHIFRVIKIVEPTIFNKIYNCSSMYKYEKDNRIFRLNLIAFIFSLFLFVDLEISFQVLNNIFENASSVQFNRSLTQTEISSVKSFLINYLSVNLIYKAIFFLLFLCLMSIILLFSEKFDNFLYRLLSWRIYSTNIEISREISSYKNYLNGKIYLSGLTGKHLVNQLRALQLNKLPIIWLALRKYGILFIFKSYKFRPWFMNKTVLEIIKNKEDNNSGKYISYYAGTYLKNMLRILHIMRIFSLLPVFMGIVILIKDVFVIFKKGIIGDSSFFLLGKYFQIHFLIFVLFVALWIVFAQNHQINRRRVILDEELFSTNSLSIVWMIVSVIHYRAFMCANFLDMSNYLEIDPDEKYSMAISSEVQRLLQSNELFNLSKWIR